MEERNIKNASIDCNYGQTGNTEILKLLIYDSKILTHEKIDEPKTIKEKQKFNRLIQKLVSNENKSCYKLIEYHPRVPKLYGLPKPHKAGIPMHSIISAIGSTPHKLVKIITIILTPFLVTISPSYVKNLGNLF